MDKKGYAGMNKDSLRMQKDPVLATMDRLCAILLALCPLLQHYVSPLFNAGITVMVLVAGYLMARMLLGVAHFRWSYLGFVTPMIIYQVFRIINHGTTVTELGQSLVFIVFMVAVAFGAIDTKMLLKACRFICLLAAGFLVLQYIFFYLFDIHLQVVPTQYLIPMADKWVLVAESGLAGVTGRIGALYRPSAFFLEPSHAYLFMFPHVILLLFNEKITKKTLGQALLISLGVLLTTSGMGIAAIMGTWGLFLVFRDERDGSFHFKNILRKRNLIAIGLLITAFVGAVVLVPSIQQAVLRIFIPGATGKTAIDGRVDNALLLIKDMTPLQWVFGISDNTHGVSAHMPGAMDILYRHGLVGCLLSYELYTKLIIKLPVAYKLIGAVVLVTSLFSAHTHSTVGMLYYVLILMDGFHGVDEQKRSVRPYTEPHSGHFLYRVYGRWVTRQKDDASST